jgi:hypothetical protein
MQASLFFSGTKPTAEDAGAENKSLVTAIKQAFEGVRIEGDDGKTTAIHVNQTFRRYDPTPTRCRTFSTYCSRTCPFRRVSTIASVW